MYRNESYLAGQHWATNLVSILSSTVPSHHGIWSEEGKLGLHVNPLPACLKRFGYRSLFVGPDDAKVIAIQCGFEDVRPISGNDAAQDIIKVLARSNNAPSFVACVLDEFPPSMMDAITRLAQDPDDGESITIIVAQLVPRVSESCSPVSVPFAVASPGIKRNHGSRAHFWALLDIAPSLLGSLALKIPYSMVGRDQHLFWRGKGRRAIKFPRERALFEYADGSKTMCSAKYMLTVHLGKEGGELVEHVAGIAISHNLWDDASSAKVKEHAMLEMLWAQMDKESVPMPRIAGA